MINRIPTVHFVLSQNRNNNNEHCIYLRVFVEGKYLKRSTNIWIKPEEWDGNTERVKRCNEDYERLNNYLGTLMESFKSKLLNQSDSITYDLVRKLLGSPERGAEVKKHLELIPYAMDYYERLYNIGEIGYQTYMLYKLRIRAFQHFLENILKVQHLCIEDVKKEYFDKYIEYKITVRKNTNLRNINAALGVIYRVIKEAENNKLIEKDSMSAIYNNFINIKRKTKYEPEAKVTTKIKYLTPREFEILHKFWKNTNRVSRNKYLDIFFFSYYASGLRISDIATLEWSNIDFDKKIINKVQVKTKRKGKLPPVISDEGLEILRRWKRKTGRKKYVFGLIPDNLDIKDEALFNYQRNNATKLANSCLTIIGKKLGFNINLTMHIARHTFAVMAINNGTNIYLLSKIMGHSNVSVTESTYAEMLKDNVVNFDIYQDYK